MNNKGSTQIILIFLFVLGLAVVGFYLYQVTHKTRLVDIPDSNWYGKSWDGKFDQKSASPSVTTKEVWKTYSNTKYGFEIQHPWTEIQDQFGSVFPGGSEPVITLLSGQTIGNHEGVTVHTNVEVLDVLPNMSLQKRLEVKLKLNNRTKGTIDTAYQNKQPTFNQSSQNGMDVYELGDFSPPFTYLTFITPPNSKHIYLITLDLFGYGNNGSAVPPDSYFIETYKKIVNSFKVTQK